MQTNDLNRLAAAQLNSENVLVSEIFGTDKPTKDELLKAKEVINPIFEGKIKHDVVRFQDMGKSRRWIKRWIKRKYNIKEY